MCTDCYLLKITPIGWCGFPINKMETTMEKRFQTVLKWLLTILCVPFYLLYLLGKWLIQKVHAAGGFLAGGGYIASATFSDQRRLGRFLNFYYETRNTFQQTTGKKYHDYVKKVLVKLFDFYPVAHSNDIRAKNLDALTVHHIKPQSAIANDQKQMTDFGNLAPCTRETHNKADRGMRVESIQGTKQKYTFRFLVFSLVNLLATTFLLGFLTELFYRAFDALRKKKTIDNDEILGGSFRAGGAMFLFSLPLAFVSYLFALVSGRVLALSIVLQVLFSLSLLALGVRCATKRAKESKTPKKTVALFCLHAICLFAVSTGLEILFSALIAYTLWKDLAVTGILALVFAADRLIFGTGEEPGKNECADQEKELMTLPSSGNT